MTAAEVDAYRRALAEWRTRIAPGRAAREPRPPAVGDPN
jgi:hypothetical protein